MSDDENFSRFCKNISNLIKKLLKGLIDKKNDQGQNFIYDLYDRNTLKYI